jgi:hypothetical protein
MPKTPITARGPVGRKLIAAFRKERSKKLVDLLAVAEGERQAQALQQSVTSGRALEELDPSHAWYVVAQQQLSLLIEQTGAMRATRSLTDPINDAEDEYMPSGPPMSPLTDTYFFFWAFCDLSPAGDGETLASATLDLVREVSPPSRLSAVMETLSASRMGLWVHQGAEGQCVSLRELVTGDERRCRVPAGYLGHAGEIWFARVLPPGTPGLDAVVVTTPYVLVQTTEAQWLAYLDRVLAAYSQDLRPQVYALLMKYGENPRYWPEYVFEGYVNHESGAVFLTGFPDIAESRPHSRVHR